MSTVTQDEELLIIQDESDTSNNSLSFNIDFEDDTKASTSEDATSSEVKSNIWTNDALEIQLDDTSESELASQASNIKTEDTPTQEIQTEEAFEISLWDDIWSQDSTSESSDIKVEVDDDSSSDQSESFDILWSAEVSEVSDSVPEQTTSSENLNDILTATIAKLALRKEAIQTDTSSKQVKVQDLKTQIEKLENQVSEIEAEITSLWLESDKIDTNITQLENMKLDPVKEHNAKRVSKK